MKHKENGILMKIMKIGAFNFVRLTFSAERSIFITALNMTETESALFFR